MPEERRGYANSYRTRQREGSGQAYGPPGPLTPNRNQASPWKGLDDRVGATSPQA
jgi:hypothetical protein